MSTQDPGCNSLKPKKLPVETLPARSSGGWYEPQVRGVKFGMLCGASGLTVNAVSRRRNPAIRRDVNAEKESW
jgi:hypothetical protein